MNTDVIQHTNVFGRQAEILLLFAVFIQTVLIVTDAGFGARLLTVGFIAMIAASSFMRSRTGAVAAGVVMMCLIALTSMGITWYREEWKPLDPAVAELILVVERVIGHDDPSILSAIETAKADGVVRIGELASIRKAARSRKTNTHPVSNTRASPPHTTPWNALDGSITVQSGKGGLLHFTMQQPNGGCVNYMSALAAERMSDVIVECIEDAPTSPASAKTNVTLLERT